MWHVSIQHDNIITIIITIIPVPSCAVRLCRSLTVVVDVIFSSTANLSHMYAASPCYKKGVRGRRWLGYDDDDDDERASRGEQRDTPPRGGRPLVADAAAKETAPIFFLNWNHVIPAVYLLFRNRINRTRREYRYIRQVP